MEDLTPDMIRQLIEVNELTIEKIEQEKKESIALVRKDTRYIRSLCKHEKTTYHPDPSGNNDSCYTCDICGLEKRRF